VYVVYMRRWVILGGWLGFLGASIAGLHRIGDWFPMDLILQPGGLMEPALAAGLRLTGLLVAYWLAGSTTLYLIGRAARVPAAIRSVRWATIGPVRHLIDRTLSGALVATIALPVSVGAMTDPGYVPVPAGDHAPSAPVVAAEEDVPDPRSDAPGTSSLPPPPVTPPLPTESGTTNPPAPGVAGVAGEIVVRPGDHMWSLAAERLASVRGRNVSDSETALYWLELIAVNLSRIRSGDPDLIFPGETLILPAIDP
jgi:hypothetical protein